MECEYFYGKQSRHRAFYRISKQLFTDRQSDTLSVEAMLLYGMMINRMELLQKNGWIDRQEWHIYFMIDEVKRQRDWVNRERKAGTGKTEHHLCQNFVPWQDIKKFAFWRFL